MFCIIFSFSILIKISFTSKAIKKVLHCSDDAQMGEISQHWKKNTKHQIDAGFLWIYSSYALFRCAPYIKETRLFTTPTTQKEFRSFYHL